MQPNIKQAIKTIAFVIIVASAMVFTHTYDNANKTVHIIGAGSTR